VKIKRNHFIIIDIIKDVIKSYKEVLKLENIVVIYQSKYGATKKYAEWLAEELSSNIIETKQADIEQVAKYDTIILGGGIYATGIAGVSFLKKHYEKLKGKRIVAPYDEKAMTAIKERNFKDKLNKIPCFYCRGAWNEKSMSWKEKTLCNILKKAVAKKDPNNYEPWEAALMQAIGSNFDWGNKENLKPLIEFIQTKL